MIINHDLQQGTTPWIKARLGVLTASRVDKLLTPKGMKLSAQSDDLLNQLLYEQLTGEPSDNFGGTYYTERGNELEAEALAYFSMQTDLTVRTAGIVYRDETKETGCSPDGLVYDMSQPPSDDALPQFGLELKCPMDKTAVAYLRSDGAPKYTPQVQFSLWVTKLPAWYFMSYHPLLPPVLHKVAPLPEWQAAFSEHVPEFLSRLRNEYTRIKTMML